MRKDLNEQIDKIIEWIYENKSKAYIAKQLNCNPKTVNRFLKKNNIEYKGNQSGKKQQKQRRILTLIDYLEMSLDVQSNKIKQKLLNEGYKEHRCEKCNLDEWLGKPIPLKLHHIDGNRYNNTLENFELLCPNCHSFTDSYRGKNISNKCVETIHLPPKLNKYGEEIVQTTTSSDGYGNIE